MAVRESGQETHSEHITNVTFVLNDYYCYNAAGHSLGAGTAILLLLLLLEQQQQRNSAADSVDIEVWAFAPPPVFTPLSVFDAALAAGRAQVFAFVHDHDVVPRTSLEALCRVSGQLVQVDRLISKRGWSTEQHTHAFVTGSLPAEFEEELTQDLESVVSTLTPDSSNMALRVPSSKMYWMRPLQPPPPTTKIAGAAAAAAAGGGGGQDLPQDLIGELVGAMGDALGDAVGTALNAVVGADAGPSVPDSVVRYGMDQISAEVLATMPMCTSETFLGDHECSSYERAVQRLAK
jgi:hypothetical protein